MFGIAYVPGYVVVAVEVGGADGRVGVCGSGKGERGRCEDWRGHGRGCHDVMTCVLMCARVQMRCVESRSTEDTFSQACETGIPKWDGNG